MLEVRRYTNLFVCSDFREEAGGAEVDILVACLKYQLLACRSSLSHKPGSQRGAKLTLW